MLQERQSFSTRRTSNLSNVPGKTDCGSSLLSEGTNSSNPVDTSVRRDSAVSRGSVRVQRRPSRVSVQSIRTVARPSKL